MEVSPAEDVVVAWTYRGLLAATPRPNPWHGREDRRKPGTVEERLWREGALPMDELEALLLRRRRNE